MRKRVTLRAVDDWAGGLHRTDRGCAKVAARFAPTLPAIV